MNKNKTISLIIFLSICFSTEFLGGLATQTSVNTWYQNLAKPIWTPPAWIFGPVWTVLYFMIGIVGWLIYISKKSKLRTKALTFYFLQLAFNFLWSFLFFYFQSPLLGLIDIILLIIFIGLTLLAVWPISKAAGYLLIPYFLWSIFALCLNIEIYYLNYVI